MPTLTEQIKDIIWKLMVGVKMGKIEPKDEEKYVEDVISIIQSTVKGCVPTVEGGTVFVQGEKQMLNTITANLEKAGVI